MMITMWKRSRQSRFNNFIRTENINHIDLCLLQTIRLKYKITNEHLTEVSYYLKIVRVVFAYQELKFVCVLLSFQFTILNNWL